MKSWIRHLGTGVAVAMLLAACGTTAAPAPEKAPVLPAWVSQIPARDGLFTYFMVSGADAGGARQKAEELAIADLAAQVARATDSTPPESQDLAVYMNNWAGKLGQSLSGTNQQGLPGIVLKDRHIAAGKAGEVRVYLLVAYGNKELDEETARRKDFLPIRDSVATLEASARKLEAAGKISPALAGYLDAALAASEAGVKNGTSRYVTLMQDVLRLLDSMSLVKVSGPESVGLGQDFGQDFAVRLQDRSGKGVADTTLGIRVGTSATAASTDADGQARIRLPAPVLAGRSVLTIGLDLESYRQRLGSLGPAFKAEAARVVEAIDARIVRFEYSIVSNARNYPTALVIGDLNKNGGLVRGSEVAQMAAASELGAAGIKVPAISFKSNFLEGKSDADILPLLGRTVGHVAKRFAFGTARIVSFEEVAGGIKAKVSGQVKVADVSTATIILVISAQTEASGANQAEAQKAALTALGKELGQQLAAKLP